MLAATAESFADGPTLEDARLAIAAGRAHDAVAITTACLRPRPDDVQILYGHAAALRAAGDASAGQVLDRASALHSLQDLQRSGADLSRLERDAAYALLIGWTLFKRWRMGASLIALSHAAKDPAHAREARFIAAQAEHYLGRTAAAEQSFLQLLLDYPDPDLHGFFLYSLFFRQDGGRAHAEEASRWSDLWVRVHRPAPPVFHVERRSDRQLRIGYLAPTFANQIHHFLIPVLDHHDRSQFEIFFYVDRPEKEPHIPGMTVRGVKGLSANATAELIRSDRIDILVDLHGHFSMGRPLAVARRPAPVQVSWMDYTHTLGLDAVDYVLHGEHMDAPGTQDLFVEKIWNIGPVLVPFRPTESARLPPAPAVRNGYVTFGSFNHPAKLNDRVVEAWSAILNACPTARLVLKYSVFADPVLCAETAARFEAHGVSAERLLFRGHSKGEAYEQAFEEVDIALDPSPVTGGTTTMEALSRGLPVLSLKGDDFYARVGMHTLMAIGLPELLGETWDDYIRIAVELARDIPQLLQLRARVRPALDASPYRDEVGFTRRLETAYREMFDRWLDRPEPAVETEPAPSAPSGPTLAQAELVEAGADLLAGRPGDAIERLDVLVERSPHQHETLYWRASALLADGRTEAGTAALEQARLFHTVELLGQLGVDVTRMRREPAYAKLVGKELYRNGMVAAASLALSCAITPDTISEEGLVSLGLSLQHQGRAEEAATMFRAAADTFQSPNAHQFLLYSLFFVPDGVRRYAAEARIWAERFTAGIQPLPGPFANDRSLDRPLKIGFVAPSFTRSQLRQFILPVVQAHDPRQVELRFYSADAEAEDAVLPGAVRGIGRLPDRTAAELIRGDDVDILFDLWGFTAGGRLPVFAYRPAPVQISWINLVQTTGMTSMDYVLHADTMDAPGTDALFAERVLRIGPTTVPYQPHPERRPQTPAPALRKGFVTFGSFNNPVRLGDETVAAWARILKGAPASRLVLKYGYYADPVLRRVMRARFAAHGVDASRLEFRLHTKGIKYLSEFADIDLALDPSPCPGGTTTCDALANGVPVLTLRGGDFYSRIGVHAVPLPELIAENWDDYVGRAIALTADAAALDRLRRRVRPAFEASPTCDAEGFTRRLEQVYRDVFAAWAAAHPA